MLFRSFKFTADKNGRYYIAWNQDKSKIPSFKVSDAVSSFAADQTVTVNVPNITAEDGKDVYVYLFAVDDNNKKATPLRYTLKASARPAAGSGGYYGGGETGETGEDTDGDGGSDAASRDGDDSDTGSTSSASNASTADNSPIGAMVSLAALSLLAGGYVIVRRRKRA